jgi:hypothetical protein
MGGYDGEGVIGVELFDILKARAVVPVNDWLAILFARPGDADILVYKTPDNKIYADANGEVYALKEE